MPPGGWQGCDSADGERMRAMGSGRAVLKAGDGVGRSRKDWIEPSWSREPELQLVGPASRASARTPLAATVRRDGSRPGTSRPCEPPGRRSPGGAMHAHHAHASGKVGALGIHAVRPRAQQTGCGSEDVSALLVTVTVRTTTETPPGMAIASPAVDDDHDIQKRTLACLVPGD